MAFHDINLVLLAGATIYYFWNEGRPVPPDTQSEAAWLPEIASIYYDQEEENQKYIDSGLGATLVSLPQYHYWFLSKPVDHGQTMRTPRAFDGLLCSRHASGGILLRLLRRPGYTWLPAVD